MARSLHRVGIRALGTLAVIEASASAQETIETPEIISALVEGKVSLDILSARRVGL